MTYYQGYLTALITPFANGKVDFASFETFVRFQIEQGIHGLVPCGTTGESPTLSSDEIKSLIEIAIRVRNNFERRIPIVAGTGSNDTARTIELTKIAEQYGADAALIVTPYYNKPTQEGLYQHYKAIHDQTNIPIILYNVPSRTAVDMSIETVIRLAELPRIVGLKDAVSDLTRVQKIRGAVKSNFSLLCGEDSLTADYLKQGGNGCISVTSNVAPGMCAELYNSWVRGDVVTFETIAKTLSPLHKNLFVETSPAPVKYACSRLEFCRDEMRLPMLPATDRAREIIDQSLGDLGLLETSISSKTAAR
jgi:4-hydroxy-tetrahydrodipicolinate synthase